MMDKVGVMLFAAGVLGAGCSKTVNQCSKDSDCMDVVYPFCDVNGEYPSSSGEHNVCTIVPPECPIERCGCSPGATTCTSSTLSTCNVDGVTTTDEACSLGCAPTGGRCLSFTPTNGLNTALLAASDEPAVSLPMSVTINTDTGIIKDGAGVALAVNSIVVSQTGAPDIRAFIASSFDVADAMVTGSKAFALVAPGKVLIHGIVDVSANATSAGPGSVETGACAGAFASLANSTGGTGGGGGNATPGGSGHTLGFNINTNMSVPGGAPGGALTTFEPLNGGCRGGGAPGGGGGGAIQIDSLDTIEVAQAGLIDLGGGGANGYNGGGSGGTIILEAPHVIVSGTVVANGAAGADCNTDSADGTRTADVAFGPSCGAGAMETHGGAGGTRTSAATSAGGFADGQGGGGGAVGRMLVKSSDGNYTGQSLVSAAITTQTLVIQ